jgi:hypothetical protein
MGQKSQFSQTLASATGDQTAGRFAGGPAAVVLTGTFNASTIIVECSVDGTNFVAITDITGDAVSATADAFFNVLLPTDGLVRFSVTGTTTSVVATIAQTISLT